MSQTSVLEVKSNGTYNIPLALDEDGLVQFPEYKFEKKSDPEVVNLTSVKNILNINKAAVAKTIDTPCLCGYYIGKRVISTVVPGNLFNDFQLELRQECSYLFPATDETAQP
jgi:hypothetical protein